MRQIWRKIAVALLTALLLSGTALAAMPDALVPVGRTIGLRLQTDGVSIVEFAENNPCAKDAGLRRGDIIRKIGPSDIETVQDLSVAVEASAGRAITVSYERSGAAGQVSVTPRQTADGWRLGIYVRDSITGIGTVTYYDPETGRFGALGHGVGDGSTLLPLRAGQVLPSSVVSVIRGKAGDPGALQGALQDRGVLGEISSNTAAGIFGTMELSTTGKALPLADETQIHTGAAVILSNVHGTQVEEYTVEILSLEPNDPQGRNLRLAVTDADLLEQTGGIVQGMSGSPIIQDGKFIGAVTHVLVNDPTTGYGIFIENMLEAGEAAA